MEVLRQYATASTINFPLIERDIQDFRTSGITFVAADTQIMQNEGAFANTGSVPAHEGNGIYSLALTATEMTAARIVITCVDSATKLWEDQAIIIQTYAHGSAGLGQLWVDIRRLVGDATLAVYLYNSVFTSIRVTVDTAAFTPTTTQFESDVTEATADHYIGRSLHWATGALANQECVVLDYALVGGRGRFTVSTLTEAPANTNIGVLMPGAGVVPGASAD